MQALGSITAQLALRALHTLLLISPGAAVATLLVAKRLRGSSAHWKACAVLQFIATHSAAAAADCVEQRAAGAIISRLMRCDDTHSKSFEMKWRALLALQALCAADCAAGTVATTQLASSAGLEAQLRAILATADGDARSEQLLLEPASWLLDKAFSRRY